jgi:uncharacterized protein
VEAREFDVKLGWFEALGGQHRWAAEQHLGQQLHRLGAQRAGVDHGAGGCRPRTGRLQEAPMTDANVAVIRGLFAAVERRDLAGVLAAYHPDVVIHEAASLPYGGTYHGLDGATRHAYAYEATWAPFQEATPRSLDAEVLDAGEHVVVLWRQRARTPDGRRALDAPAVSVYRMRDGLIAESRMFQQDTAAIARFLAEARPAAEANSEA